MDLRLAGPTVVSKADLLAGNLVDCSVGWKVGLRAVLWARWLADLSAA